jgi:hypothetical protein
MFSLFNCTQSKVLRLETSQATFKGISFTSICSKKNDGRSNMLQKDFDKITDKLERLSIEHRALKFERQDSEKRLKMLEAAKDQS